MGRLIINQDKVGNKDELVKICPFGALEIKDDKLDINSGCKMCKLCVRKGPEGAVVFIEDEKKEIDILKEENPNNLSWKTKQLRFNDTPLEKVIRDLNEYYQVEIINKVDSPDSRLTATFNDLPLDEVLMVINQTLDIRLVPRKDK